MSEEDFKNENIKLKEELALYKPNGSVAFYYELNKFINETVAIMREEGLKNLLVAKKDENPKKFEHIMALIKNAKEHVMDMADIKSKLKLSGDQEKDLEIPFVESIAKDRN